jgi:hypothetical protein
MLKKIWRYWTDTSFIFYQYSTNIVSYILQKRAHYFTSIFLGYNKTSTMVDPDEDDIELHTRMSPRFTGKKTTANNQVEDVLSDSSSETRPRKKTKTQPKLNPKKANAKQVCTPF